MKSLQFSGEIYKAEKIVKEKENIIGYTGNKIIFAFRGIKDFSQFHLEDSQDWNISEEDEQILYQLDIDYRLSKLELNL